MAKTQLISRKMLESARNPAFVISALAQIDEGAFEEARKTLEKGLESSATRPIEGLLALASAYWDDPDQRARDPKKSIEFLKEAIQLAPKDARPYALLGRYLLSKGLRDQALNFLDRAIALDPENAGVRRLRDRATLQKKKQYTVVKQAKDFTQQKPKRKGGGAGKAEGFKAQATRLLNLKDLGGAAKELEKAQVGEDKSIDNAIASLLKTDLIGADRKLLESQNKGRRGGLILRTVIALVFLGALGALCGVGVQQFAPKASGTKVASTEDQLLSDRVSAFEKIIEASLDAEGEELTAAAAASHALLLIEHGGDEGHLESAEGVLSAASSAIKTQPEALLARSILSQNPLAEPDPELSRDLREALGDEKRKSSPFVLMAAAENAIKKGDLALAKEQLGEAAFKHKAPRALHRLARLQAAEGNVTLALDLLKKLWRDDQKHGASLATAFALIAQGPSAKERNTLEKELEKRLQEIVLPNDAAPGALALLALSFAREDTKTAGAMKQLLTETDVLDRYPKLLAIYSELLMTEIDDVARAQNDVEKGLEKNPGEIILLTDQTRAKVLRSLPEDRIRQLRTAAEREVQRTQLTLPLGLWKMDYTRLPVPYTTEFDTRFFPEAEIQNALGIRGLNAQSAKRRLQVVARLKLAEVSLAAGDIEAALEYVEQAEKDGANNPEVHLTRALIYANQKQKEKARVQIEKALDIEPDDPRILLAAATLQRAAGDKKAAQKALARLKSEGFRSPKAHIIASRLALDENDFDAALEQLSAAKKLAPEALSTLLLEGELLARQGKINAATSLAKTWLKTPGFGQASERKPIIRGLSLLAKLSEDNANKTQTTLSELVASSPKEPLLRIFLGVAEKRRSDLPAAQDAFNAALRRVEKDSPLRPYLNRELGNPSGDEGKKRKKKKKSRRKK